MAATAGFLHLPLDIKLPVLQNPLHMPPIYIAAAIVLVFALVPPFVFLWAIVSKIIKQRWRNGKKPFPPTQYFTITVSADEVKQAKEKKGLAARFWNTILKTQILGDWEKDNSNTNVLKIWKQKTKQLLLNELMPQDKYRLLNFTVRVSTTNPKQMIIFGCLHFLEGPLDETFMQYAFVDEKEEISLRQRIMACSDETQGLLQLVQEPDKYSNDQCCFLCCLKIKKKKGGMGSGQLFIDDIFETTPVAGATKEEEEDKETIRISICFPVCSKECLMNCVKILHKINQTRDTENETTGQDDDDSEEEEEKKEEEDT